SGRVRRAAVRRVARVPSRGVPVRGEHLMSDGLIQFDRGWKKFRRGERHNSLRDLIPAMGRALFSQAAARGLQRQEFWALQDVSFIVRPGEALGIIGPN